MKICALNPARTEPTDFVFETCAALGFDAVALAPFADGIDDVDALISRTLALAAKHDLALWLDLPFDRADGESPFVQERRAWFRFGRSIEGEPPDPRRGASNSRDAHYRWTDAQVGDAIAREWSQRVQQWIDAGIGGFVCRGVGSVPAARWLTLIRAARRRKAVTFVAWTLGLDPPALRKLRGAGFDYTTSSLAYWNGRDAWFAEELERLQAVAPVLAPIARAEDDGALACRDAKFRLSLAAAVTDGALIPADLLCSDGTKASGECIDAEWLDDVARAAPGRPRRIRALTGPGARTTALWLGGDDGESVVLVNPDRTHVLPVSLSSVLADVPGTTAALVDRDGRPIGPGDTLILEPGETRVLGASASPPIVAPRRRSAGDAAQHARVAIERISPCVDDGRFPVKRTVGECVTVEADVFMDGHGQLGVELQWRAADELEWQRVRMRALGNDRYAAELPLARLGRHQFTVEAWYDRFATYRDELQKKEVAGVDVSLELREGLLLVEAFLTDAGASHVAALTALRETLKAGTDAARLKALLSPETATLMAQADPRPFRIRRDEALTIDAERLAARFASWYELFPRSQSGDANRHGTFDDVIARLPAIRDMGFDVLYMPPIHPIGKKHRKGRNNSLTAQAGEPGSPYAIGSDEGGHDAIHPELGTIADFRRLRDAAHAHGLELALDFAVQCSPDHPWLKQHPDWFEWRPDGSIRYAENPPKKYQDIVNVDFYADGAVPSLWEALRDVVQFWVDEGVKTFRVDNPHTKPFVFWEWLIADIRDRDPEVVFLSEAFTRPKPMYRLAKLGFSQSYTYFTWRNEKREIEEYLTELSTTAPKEFFRPHFFVNTPDINPYFLQRSGRPGHLIRAALATTLSGLWGMYQGFELCEARAINGKEEYLDSEKYELRAWDNDRPGNIVDEITRLNHVRRANPALRTHLGVQFWHAANDRILCYTKSTPDHSNVVLALVNLDPHEAQAADFELPLWLFGLPDDGRLVVEDLMRERTSVWQGKHQHIRLDPHDRPFVLYRLSPERHA